MSVRLTALWKQGWNEIPEIMGSGCAALIGIAMGLYTVYDYEKNDGHNKRYKLFYTIMRPDDPRTAKVHKD